MLTRRRIVAAATAAAVAGMVMGTALALGGDPNDPLSAADIYTADMTLDEVARAASGQPGEVAPPCPDSDTVKKLKEAELEFGPCDVVPEPGKPVLLPRTEQDPPPEEREGAVNCPAIHGGKGTPELSLYLPCAPGAAISDSEVVVRDGKLCLDVTYVAGTGADAVREVLCEGDSAKIGGNPVGTETPDEHED